MKKIVWLVLLTPVLFSCQEQKAKISQLEAERDSLRIVANQNDQTTMEYLTAFNDIQDNLDKIKEKEGFIKLNSDDIENQSSTKDQIVEDIQLIYDLMLENKQKLESLEKKYKSEKYKNKELQEFIAGLKKQIEEKDAQILKLRNQLAILNITVDSLGVQLDTLKGTVAHQEQVITDQEDEINTAFYVFGTEKELKEQKILTKEGGFIGIGKNTTLKQDFNTFYFTKVDIRELKEIPLLVSSAKIITVHPSDSYVLVGDKKQIEKIEISKPKKFWSASKYLVIVVEN